MAKKSPSPVKKSSKLSKFKKYDPVIRKVFIVALGIFFGIFALDFNKNYSVQIKQRSANESNETSSVANTSARVVYKLEPRPKYWFYMARGYMWIFFSIDNVLKKLGLEKIEIEVKRHQKVHNDWDLLWSYDYHNEIPIDFSKLQYYQKINHIPGNFVLCMKDNLAVNTDSKFIPKGFNNTESLLAYAKEHPNTRYVQKLWSNRGVELKEAEDIDFKMFGPGYKYFAQVYIENPLLIDGFKFDFGIYVLITSIDPLRIYIYNKNTLIRMCEKKYDPNNYEDVDSYVISDACQFPWDVDALSVYYNKSFTYKDAMNAYFTNKGFNMNKVWADVEEAIREIVLQKEYSFIYWSKLYNYKYSFFELYRFDFMLDADLNLYLIEINQSPNVNPSEKLWRDQRMFENLLFDCFTLLGIGRYVKRSTFEFGPPDEETMIGHEESFTVRPETCINSPCNESCEASQCNLCWDCLERNQRHDLHLAYRENKHRGAMKRVFPPSKEAMDELGDEYLETLSPANKHHTEWFMEMCEKDYSFC